MCLVSRSRVWLHEVARCIMRKLRCGLGCGGATPRQQAKRGTAPLPFPFYHVVGCPTTMGRMVPILRLALEVP